MRESELALESAINSRSPDTSRAASQVLLDARIHRNWELQHAQLLLPVAEHRKREPQIFELRRIDTAQIQCRSLIRFIRKQQLTGRARKRLFSVFYGPKDLTDAILTEHRRYLIAESSRLSTDHLIGLMHDAVSEKLLANYASAYDTYFSLYCYVECNNGNVVAEAAKTAMQQARQRVSRLRKRVLSEKPFHRPYDFDREALLAASGRHKAINYMNR